MSITVSSSLLGRPSPRRASHSPRTRGSTMRTPATLAIALLPWLLAPVAAPAAEPSPDPADDLALVLHHEAERAGDFDRLAADWLSCAANVESDAALELLLRRLASLVGRLRRPDAITQPLASLLDGDRLRGEARDVATEILAAARLREGRRAEAERLHAGRGLVESYLVIGPFGKNVTSPLHRPFRPEKGLSLDDRIRDGWQELVWRRLPAAPPGSMIDPRGGTWPRRGVVYSLAQIRGAKATPARLHFLGQGRSVVWWNGSVAIDERTLSEYPSSARRVDVELHEGWNRLLVKSPSAFRMRLTDRADEPLRSPAVEIETERVLHAVDRSPPDARPRTLRESRALRSATEAADASLPTEGDDTTNANLSAALRHLAVAALWRTQGRSDQAVDRVRIAVELAPDDPWVLHHAARTWRYASYLPPSRSKNRAQQAWERALEVDEGFLPAYVNLARLRVEDEKTDEAVELLRTAETRSSTFLYGQMELHRVFEQKRWEAEARAVLDRIRRVAPGNPFAPLELAERYASRGNLARAIDLYREALDLDRSRTSLLGTIAGLEARRGESGEAERWLRRRMDAEPHDDSARWALADFLSHRGRHDEAIAQWRAEVEERPWDPSRHRRLATLLERAGRSDDAKAARTAAVRLGPGQLRLASSLDRDDPASEAFWEPWDEDLESWTDRVPTSGPMVEKAAAITILDISVVEVRVDGSYHEYIHQATRLLSEEAKDDVAKVSTPGEIVTLRTVAQDGAELEPVAATGRSSFVMPGVAPGATTDVAYVVRHENREGRLPALGPFFFQDFRYQQSFLLSRYVLILPEGWAADLDERELDPQETRSGRVTVEKRTRELDDGRQVLVYEARASQRLESERLMPAYEEYVANTSWASRHTWDEVGADLAERALGASLPTPELERAARELVDGVDDPLERARKIYAHVTELVSNPQGSGSAVRVLLEKAGDRTALFKALADLAGLKTRWAWLRPADDMMPRPDWSRPSADMFPSRHVLLETEASGPVWIRLSSRDLPFGRIDEQFSEGSALVLEPDGGHRTVSLPRIPPETYASGLNGTIRLLPEAAADVEIRIVLGPTASYAQKDRFRTLPAFQKMLAGQQIANQVFRGAQVREFDFLHLDSDEPLTIAFSAKAPQVLTESGDDLLMPSVRQASSLVRGLGGPPDRKHPYHLRLRRAVSSRLRVEPGDAYEIRSTPDDVILNHSLARYSLRFRREEGAVLVEQDLTLLPGRLAAAEFAEFLAFCQQVDAAEKGSLVFRKKP